MDPKTAVGGKKNSFADLNEQGAATVTVALEEKLSGPSGTYSSVSVRIEVSARCDQNETAIRQARDVLVNEGMKALDFYAGPAVSLLTEHTKKQKR